MQSSSTLNRNWHVQVAHENIEVRVCHHDLFFPVHKGTGVLLILNGRRRHTHIIGRNVYTPHYWTECLKPYWKSVPGRIYFIAWPWPTHSPRPIWARAKALGPFGPGPKGPKKSRGPRDRPGAAIFGPRALWARAQIIFGAGLAKARQ